MKFFTEIITNSSYSRLLQIIKNQYALKLEEQSLTFSTNTTNTPTPLSQIGSSSHHIHQRNKSQTHLQISRQQEPSYTSNPPEPNTHSQPPQQSPTWIIEELQKANEKKHNYIHHQKKIIRKLKNSLIQIQNQLSEQSETHCAKQNMLMQENHELQSALHKLSGSLQKYQQREVKMKQFYQSKWSTCQICRNQSQQPISEFSPSPSPKSTAKNKNKKLRIIKVSKNLVPMPPLKVSTIAQNSFPYRVLLPKKKYRENSSSESSLESLIMTHQPSQLIHS
jgi:hypothetical protein